LRATSPQRALALVASSETVSDLSAVSLAPAALLNQL
jgi:hypothetical protein